VAKPNRDQQPDKNILWLLKRHKDKLHVLSVQDVVDQLMWANKPTTVGEVQKALTRLSKAKGTKVRTENLGKDGFELILVDK